MAAVVASSASSSPSIERRARSRSFGAITPSFSSDLSKLRASTSSSAASSSSSSGSIVHTFQEAIAIAKTLDVLGTNSPLRSKLILNKEEDWIKLISDSGAVNKGVDEKVSIHLEKLLRYCFDIAYKLPPNYSQSFTSSTTKNHMRSSSLAALAAFATAPSDDEGENSERI